MSDDFFFRPRRGRVAGGCQCILRFVAKQVFALSLLLVLMAGLAISGMGVPVLLRQGFIWVTAARAEQTAGLAPASLVDHCVAGDGLSHLTAEPQEDFPGWIAYTPGPDSFISHIYIDIFKDVGCVTFYPRVFGGDSRILIFELRGARKIPVFTLTGEGQNWSPIGLRAIVNLGWNLNCAPCDRMRRFEIVLYGKKAQLWGKGAALAF